ncbi:hypothetical protein [Paraburkholderia sp. 40]|uniref:hypothetical protein n=1 Tax=Paraburkholderia sp. 40 TaxID=2991059 RepID=UPI003D19F8A6
MSMVMGASKLPLALVAAASGLLAEVVPIVMIERFRRGRWPDEREVAMRRDAVPWASIGSKAAGFVGSERRIAGDVGANSLDDGRRDVPAICAQVAVSKRFRRRKWLKRNEGSTFC